MVELELMVLAAVVVELITAVVTIIICQQVLVAEELLHLQIMLEQQVLQILAEEVLQVTIAVPRGKLVALVVLVIVVLHTGHKEKING
jgi:hypothetical protein